MTAWACTARSPKPVRSPRPSSLTTPPPPNGTSGNGCGAKPRAAWCSYRADTDQFWLTPAQTLAFADPQGLVLPGAFQMAVGFLQDLEAITERFRTGEGFAWGAHSDDVAIGCERFFRPGYVANLVSSWLPAVNGLVDRLEQGIAVADVGCGLGSSTRILAETYPASTLTGFDNDPVSIELADKLAADAGLGDRVAFAVAAAADFPGGDLGLVTHVRLSARHGRSGRRRPPHPQHARLRRRVADRRAVRRRARWSTTSTPVGRLYYSASTFLCVPHALSEGSSDALGSQAGQQVIARVVAQAGFSRFQRVSETPFNIVYEARP